MKNKPDLQEVRSRVFDNVSLISQSLASPIRLRILQTLANSPCTVETISQKTSESIANTSQHLQKMLRSSLVTCSRQGTSRIYSVANDEAMEVWLALQRLAFQLSPQIQQDEELLCPAELCTDIELEDCLKLVHSNKAVLVDVRDERDANGTPVPYAIHVPAEQIQKKLNLFPKSKTIFVFCRGRYCNLANPVVQSLRKAGYKAFRLREMSYEISKFSLAK